MFSVTVWGDRGSIPCPGKDTVVYGGNTSCLEIRAGDKLVIVDFGTGCKPLGDKLMKAALAEKKFDADIFITHTHWDHIMGFPMFAPVFLPFAKIRIRGPVSYEDESLEQIIGSQLTYRYWPVRLDELSAHIEYSQIKETSLDLGDGLWVQTKYLNHPILCLGYRFSYEGKSIVTAYDNEPFRNLFPTDPADPSYDAEAAEEGEAAAREANENILWFYKDADVLIHDTQYTAEEYRTHVGWGHSSFEYAINAANKAEVKKLILFHHDPNRTDGQLAELETRYRKKIAGKTTMEIFVAREGLKIEV